MESVDFNHKGQNKKFNDYEEIHGGSATATPLPTEIKITYNKEISYRKGWEHKCAVFSRHDVAEGGDRLGVGEAGGNSLVTVRHILFKMPS